MDEEYPDKGTEDKGQQVNTGRSGARVPPYGDVRTQAAEPPPDSELPPTGDGRVDAAVAGLGRLRGLPVRDHVAALEEAYGRLRDVLGELSESADPDLSQGRP